MNFAYRASLSKPNVPITLTACLHCRQVPLVRHTQPATCQVDHHCRQGFFAELATGLHVVSIEPSLPRFSFSIPLSVCLSVCCGVCPRAFVDSSSISFNWSFLAFSSVLLSRPTARNPCDRSTQKNRKRKRGLGVGAWIYKRAEKRKVVRITGLKWTEQRQLGASTSELKTLIIARGFDRGGAHRL